MEILLINNEQDLIFKSNRSKVLNKNKEKQLGNTFASKTIKVEFASNIKLYNFIKSHFNLSSKNNYFTSTSERINLEELASCKFSSILNLKEINDIRYINKFLKIVNSTLPINGLYLGKVVTYPNKRSAILKKYPPVFNKIIYFFHYIFFRVLPKLPITKNIYFHLTKGRGRVISRAEIYGRLYSCGFEIIDEKNINHSLFFVIKKVKNPYYDKKPSYAPLIRLNRIGKNGKIIKVYKLRTMHPYAEYLQEYVYKRNELQDGGKIKNDFRISPEGRFLRKFWIDELPMIINIIKGDMKIVGVRPLSKHYYSLYNKDLQEERIKNKPGFIPPFYVDLPKTINEIMESEKKYLKLYNKSPLLTDVNYFFKAFKNVLFKGARSS